ncbi:hypothetical protein AcW2_007294 [Taiwanofungus camphoratus]|nr:hypothetical protein AcW2_007294 [Antrodia cinnamomea]
MDNNHAGGFMQHLLDANPQIGHIFQNIVRGLMHQQAPPPDHEPSLPGDDPDLADLPPLEPIPNPPAPGQQDIIDREMTPADGIQSPPGQDVSPAAPPTSTSQDEPYIESSGYESDGSMPSLWAASDSNSDVDMHDIEMTMNPDEEPRHQPSESSEPASSTTARSSRRARVDDGDNHEDLRETNRQRIHSPDRDDEVPADVPPPHNADGNRNAPHDQPPPLYSRVMYTFDFFPGPPPPPPPTHGAEGGPPGQDDHNHNHDNHDHDHNHDHDYRHGPPPMFNFSIQIPVSPPGFAENTLPQDQGGGEGVPPPQQGMPNLAQFFGIPVGGATFGFPGGFPFFQFGMPEDEHDDLERADRLIRGLEEVPMGLVKRMEKVGGPGTAQGDSPGCSICWESLESEGGGFEEDAAAAAAAREASMEPESDVPRSASSTPSSDRRSHSPSENNNSQEEELPKIVVLPCSHVFHTSCLRPWFSKPHRTTCPSCRFDIDPDSLTYRPQRARRPPRTQAQAQGPAQASAGVPFQPQADTQSVPPQQPQPIPQAVPNNQPLTNTAPVQNQGRPQVSPAIAFNFGVFFAGPAPPGAAASGGPVPPGYMRLDEQAARGLFERFFTAGRAATGAGGPVPQPQPEANAHGASPTAAPPHPGIPNVSPNTARPQRPPEKRQWSLPAPPGPTLRQRVERRERELGLRCWDVSCGLGPSDEDPSPVIEPTAMRQIHIRPLAGAGERVCEHMFHPSCLVSAERVAGWGGEDKKEEKEGGEVEVSCPVCRAVGAVSKMDWEDGACVLA